MSAVPDLQNTPEQIQLANVISHLATPHDWANVMARADGALPAKPDTIWATLVDELGVTTLALPEEFGGGGTWADVSVVMEGLGRAIHPVPYLGISVLALATVRELGDVELLQAAGAGRTFALAVPGSQRPWDPAPDTLAMDSGRLTGTVRSVIDAGVDEFLVPVGDDLVKVAAAAPGVEVHEVVSLDMTRPVFDIEFSSAPGFVIPGGAHASAAGLWAAAAMLTSEQVGLAQTCFDMTLGYLLERRQFGRQIASYQAVKHRMADLWIELGQARSLARYAALALDSGEDVELVVGTAKSYCSEVATRIAEQTIQLHGGIGFTWEHPAHLLLKRARADSLLFGTPDTHRAHLASRLGLVAG